MASVIKAGNATDGVQVTSDNTGILELKTGTGAGTTAMTLDASQNVGIGTTLPTNLLSVAGNANFTGNVTLGDASTDTVTVNGYMGVGGAGVSQNALNIISTGLTGSSACRGVNVAPTFQSGATSSGSGVVSAPSTAAASFTMANMYSFAASNGTKGAGSTITNQYGFQCDDLTRGDNIFGFSSAISSGANKWNIYASGTAQNYFAGNVGIGTTSPRSLLDLNSTRNVKMYWGTAGTLGETQNSAGDYIANNLYVSAEVATMTYTKTTSDNGNAIIQSYDKGIRFYTGVTGAVNTTGTLDNFEQMRLDSSGNLLVGTASAYAPISNRQIRVQASNTPGFLIVDRGNIAVGDEAARIIFGVGVANNRYASIASFVPAGSAGVDFADLRFYTMNGGSSGPTLRAQITVAGNFVPGADNTYTCGQSGTRWSAIWAANGTIQTSDARQKNTITDSDLGLAFISSLRPVSYKWNVGRNVVSKDDEGNDVITPRAGVRTHYGLIAQEVKEALGDKDFGGFIHDSETDEMGLRYDQFISPLIKAIQEQQAMIDELKAEIAALKGAAQ